MMTRFGVRCVDMIRSHNSPYFFRNIALYLGKDAHADLRRYLGPTFDRINMGWRCTPAMDLGTGMQLVDEVGNKSWAASIYMWLPDWGEVIVRDGGDAAAANASAGLEPPPSREGCCFYCEERRVN